MRLAEELAVVDPAAVTLDQAAPNRSRRPPASAALIEGVRSAPRSSPPGARTRGVRAHRGREWPEGSDPLARSAIRCLSSEYSCLTITCRWCNPAPTPGHVLAEPGLFEPAVRGFRGQRDVVVDPNGAELEG